MRKILLSILVLFVCAISFGQRTAPTSLPSPNSAGYSKVGFYRADSALLLGIRTDTNWHPIVPALTSVKFAGQDTSRLYYWNGLNWQLAGNSSGGGSSTPYVDSIYIRSGESTDSMFYLKNNVEYYWGVIDVANGLISGGQVTWTGTGYDFYVSAAVYRINGTRYTSRDTTLTLTSSDPTNPRIDVFVANTSGVATFLTGTAASNPVVPQIDPNTDVQLTSILVTAASASPTVDTATVYDENIEWTGTGVGVTINTANTAALTVYRGTYSTEINTLTNNDYVKYVTGSPINVATKQSLSFFIRLKAGWTNAMNLRVRLYSGGTALGTELIVPISRTNFNWQGFSIPMANFALNSTVVDEVRFRFTSGGSVAGYYLDWVYFQSGVAPTPSADYVESVRRSGDSVQQYINGSWQYAFTVSDKADKTTELFAGWGILGGGTIAANRTFAVDSSGTVASKLWTLDRIAEIPSGGITALTGDVTASGSGSVAATLATVNSNVGSFTNANITVNAKGLITAASNGSGGGGVTTMAAIGATPNANGATISGTTLNLEPASASFGGVVTTGTQTFAGAKTFNSFATANDQSQVVKFGRYSAGFPLAYFQLQSGATSYQFQNSSGTELFDVNSTRSKVTGNLEVTGTFSPLSISTTADASAIGLNIGRFNAGSNSSYINATSPSAALVLQVAGSDRVTINASGISTASITTTGGSTFQSVTTTTDASAVGITIGRYSAGFPYSYVKPNSTSSGIMFQNASGTDNAYLMNNGNLVLGDNIITNSTANAIVNLNTTTKGFLPPRMTRTERVAISSPAVGLHVVDTDSKAIWFNLNGSTTTWGAVYAAQDTVATDADFTMPVYSSFVILPTISNNRTVTLPVAPAYENKTIIIKVANSAGFAWSVAVAIKDKTDADVTALTNDTVYTLYSDGTYWHITSLY